MLVDQMGGGGGGGWGVGGGGGGVDSKLKNGPLAKSSIDPRNPLKPRATFRGNGKIQAIFGPAGGF